MSSPSTAERSRPSWKRSSPAPGTHCIEDLKSGENCISYFQGQQNNSVQIYNLRIDYVLVTFSPALQLHRLREQANPALEAQKTAQQAVTDGLTAYLDANCAWPSTSPGGEAYVTTFSSHALRCPESEHGATKSENCLQKEVASQDSLLQAVETALVPQRAKDSEASRTRS